MSDFSAVAAVIQADSGIAKICSPLATALLHTRPAGLGAAASLNRSTPAAASQACTPSSCCAVAAAALHCSWRRLWDLAAGRPGRLVCCRAVGGLAPWQTLPCWAAGKLQIIVATIPDNWAMVRWPTTLHK